jgi:dihydrofolate reductase
MVRATAIAPEPIASFRTADLRSETHTGLLEHDLIDEHRILVHPVLLGKGRTFLEDGAKQVNLELVDTVVISSGVAVLAYQPVR